MSECNCLIPECTNLFQRRNESEKTTPHSKLVQLVQHEWEKKQVLHSKWPQHVPQLLEHAAPSSSNGMWESGSRYGREANILLTPLMSLSVFFLCLNSQKELILATQSLQMPVEKDLGLQFLQSCCHASSHRTCWKWNFLESVKMQINGNCRQPLRTVAICNLIVS